jgi:hypothetical protein
MGLAARCVACNGRWLFVIAVMQLVGSTANFFNQFEQHEPDHTSQNGNNEHAHEHDRHIAVERFLLVVDTTKL